jgi:hypothetical protein
MNRVLSPQALWTLLLAAAGLSSCHVPDGDKLAEIAATAEDHVAASVTRFDPPRDVLFVGNSFTYYNNSIHNHYRKLVYAARGSDWPNTARLLAISGGRLDEHRGGLRQRLDDQDFDVVVLQGHSLEPLQSYDRFEAAATDYVAAIRADGAKPVLFMTWAYTSRPKMTERLLTAYSRVGRKLNASVVPVGLAFATVMAERPDLALRIADNRHPTLVGSYLGACTMFGALHQQSPVGLGYTAGLLEVDARYLQAIAWKVLQGFQSRSR